MLLVFYHILRGYKIIKKSSANTVQSYNQRKNLCDFIFKSGDRDICSLAQPCREGDSSDLRSRLVALATAGMSERRNVSYGELSFCPDVVSINCV